MYLQICADEVVQIGLILFDLQNVTFVENNHVQDL